ncbi:tyrosine-protein phosphatase siw14 [Knufia obscura]|uniref:diphosphoinositol-polyphosphate diphosphatase n=1 Tax=Knufia obscura TaxID=1635080 RepID=A0ABR0RWY5_9EURO|nr:tyrosine-protein phosphatase siw14 [Knufia obscura]
MALLESNWTYADRIAKALCAVVSPPEYSSQTIKLDQSHPPTPDGTGRPTNFQTIAPGIYRSSYPLDAHFAQLENLSLKTIITFVSEELPLAYGNFISTNGIVHHQIHIRANKDPDVYTDAATVHRVLEIMLDPSNYPLLIHCNKGKHRTGCMTACFRKVCGWTDEAAIEEYVRHSTPKDRELDEAFIRRFDATPLKSLALERGYVGGVYKQPLAGDTQISERSEVTVYTNNSVATYGTSEAGEVLHEYQEKVQPFKVSAQHQSQPHRLEVSTITAKTFEFDPAVRSAPSKVHISNCNQQANPLGGTIVMSSNVGLSTPRGSGTSGYVQRNLSTLKPRATGYGQPYSLNDSARPPKIRKPDEDILKHDRLREIEVKVLELQDKLEEAGELDEEEIEEECEKLRTKMVGDVERGRDSKNGRSGARVKSYQVHELAEAKARESEKLRRALGLKGETRDGEEGEHPMARQERRKREAEVQRVKREEDDGGEGGARRRRYEDD